MASILACWAIHLTQTLWYSTARVTFGLVVWVLRPLLPDMRTNLSILQIGTGDFSVQIAPECSGLEGMALLTVLGSLWLGIFRKEYRFPQALILLPVGVGVLFLANIARLSVLILLGSVGAREVALGGFHSQAGWISFNAIAFGLCAISRKIAWTASPELLEPATVASPAEKGDGDDTNPVAPYLMPFLAILAASMLATASSGSFEWLYPLRFFAAAIALWAYRKQYSRISWRFDWIAVATGIGVFVFWLGMDRLTSAGAKGMPQPLADASAGLRWAWIGLRVLAGVVATPIAEELAFRGYALRRLIGAKFESVPFLQAHLFSGAAELGDHVRNHAVWIGLAGSSLIFGALHGGHWFAGAIAGAVYGLLMLRSGRLGDAIAAHAVTNACLAAVALIANRWDLWG
jgi:exosortase E/protease (VPEID-CTERM system)